MHQTKFCSNCQKPVRFDIGLVLDDTALCAACQVPTRKRCGLAEPTASAYGCLTMSGFYPAQPSGADVLARAKGSKRR